jgi:hypothetical protein
MNDSEKNALDGEEVLKRNSEREMSNRDTLRVALNPKSVAIIGARGPVTDGVGRLRAARQAPLSSLLKPCQCFSGASDNENKIGGNRGLVSAGGARLRKAIRRPPADALFATKFIGAR